MVARFIHGLDQILDEEAILYAPEQIQLDIVEHAYKDIFSGLYIMPMDGGRYINHSYNPNIGVDPIGDFAIKDIEIGEELTMNYNEFEKYPDEDNILYQICKLYNFDITYRK